MKDLRTLAMKVAQVVAEAAIEKGFDSVNIKISGKGGRKAEPGSWCTNRDTIPWFAQGYGLVRLKMSHLIPMIGCKPKGGKRGRRI